MSEDNKKPPELVHIFMLLSLHKKPNLHIQLFTDL